MDFSCCPCPVSGKFKQKSKRCIVFLESKRFNLILLYFYRLTIWTFGSLRLFPSIFPPPFTYTTTHFLNGPFRPATTHMTEIFKRMFAFLLYVVLLFRKGCREFYFVFFFSAVVLCFGIIIKRRPSSSIGQFCYSPRTYTHT